MPSDMSVLVEDHEKDIRHRFRSEGIEVVDLQTRLFPGESIFIVFVHVDDFSKATKLAAELDVHIENGFVTVKQGSSVPARKPKTVKSVNDDRVSRLIEFLNERSRTSEKQPALEYIKDLGENLRIAQTRRNHLFFGRRGVGKTALLLEAKRRLEDSGHSTVWVNVQTFRELNAAQAFLNLAERICEMPHRNVRAVDGKWRSVSLARENVESIRAALNASEKGVRSRAAKLIPRIQSMISTYVEETQEDVFIFLDDVHYLPIDEQADYLDMAHGVTRDAGVWLKVAGIRHQTRYFADDPPRGLQQGHDATVVNLDLTTLEDPEFARSFLVDILRTYLVSAGIPNLAGFIASPSIDRLVLASGGVPRDFLLLCAETLRGARRREGGKVAGIQDVNKAAGQTAQAKIRELEDDAASSLRAAAPKLLALNVLKQFLLNEAHCTFFRVGFSDKENNQEEYKLLQSLMDLRMLHLVRDSLSDSHTAGVRYEVFMIDLSQYSVARLKQKMRVLDFQKDHLLVKETHSKKPARHGTTATALQTILRSGPLFELERLRVATDPS